MKEQKRRQELADFLRTRRERISPAQLGLPEGGRRRTPGLRREEVAQIAGVSTTWYTWLEQGRDVRVSTHVLESLARAFQLDAVEKAYLYHLADPASGFDRSCVQESVSPALQRVLTQMGNSPAYIRGQRMDILAWNRASCAVLGNFCQMPASERNTLYRFFCDPALKQFYVNWEELARRVLAQFRANAGPRVGDPWFKELIERVQQRSSEFRQWWMRHEIVGTPQGRKELNHPLVGRLVFEHTTFTVSNIPTLQLVLFVPLPEEETISKLASLLARECPPGCALAHRHLQFVGAD
jgi:transcriptional regulator with XRE-family HTH domain